jgi:hypothetical protein
MSEAFGRPYRTASLIVPIGEFSGLFCQPPPVFSQDLDLSRQNSGL